MITDLEHAPGLKPICIIRMKRRAILYRLRKFKKEIRTLRVCVAQDALWALGYPITKISGVFDAELDQAVRAFQRDHGLVADGIVGKLTWESLMSQLRPIPGIDEETAA